MFYISNKFSVNSSDIVKTGPRLIVKEFTEEEYKAAELVRELLHIRDGLVKLGQFERTEIEDVIVTASTL